jgi:uncharacterized Tic20 family protein
MIFMKFALLDCRNQFPLTPIEYGVSIVVLVVRSLVILSVGNGIPTVESGLISIIPTVIPILLASSLTLDLFPMSVLQYTEAHQ